MAQPTLNAVHISAPLTQMSLAFMQDLQEAYIATKVFPIIPVEKQSDKYYTYEKGSWFRDEAKKRAPGTPLPLSGYGISTDNYACDVFGIGKAVADQIRANADAAIDLDGEAVKFVTQKCMLRMEIDWVSTFFTTSVWTGSTTAGDIAPGTKWNAANSTPIADISAQMDSVLKKTGQLPNTLVLARAVWTALKTNADFLNRVTGGSTNADPAKVTPQLLAQVLELDRVLISNGIKNTAVEGAATSMAFITGDEGALLCYTPPSPGLYTPAAGYTFAWSGFLGANAAGMRMKRYRDEKLESDVVEGEAAYDHKLVAAELGAFFSDVLT
jgi:hypothetical protein